MKHKIIILTLTLCAVSLFIFEANGQYRNETEQADLASIDSIETVNRNEIKAQKTKDANRMADAKSVRKEAKENAKEARRIEKDATLAANEAARAVRAERKAQKSRIQATQQAEKASKAKDKSDKN